jgi:hypothetical protein
LEDDAQVRKRIEKDLALFEESVRGIKAQPGGQAKVLELAKMYASDSRSFLDKGDLYTSFSAIAYAHGLIDALKAMEGIE